MSMLDVLRRHRRPAAIPPAAGPSNVGTCAACQGPVLRQLGHGAVCPCGATRIPERFLVSGRWSQ